MGPPRTCPADGPGKTETPQAAGQGPRAVRGPYRLLTSMNTPSGTNTCDAAALNVPTMSGVLPGNERHTASPRARIRAAQPLDTARAPRVPRTGCARTCLQSHLRAQGTWPALSLPLDMTRHVWFARVVPTAGGGPTSHARAHRGRLPHAEPRKRCVPSRYPDAKARRAHQPSARTIPSRHTPSSARRHTAMPCASAGPSHRGRDSRARNVKKSVSHVYRRCPARIARAGASVTSGGMTHALSEALHTLWRELGRAQPSVIAFCTRARDARALRSNATSSVDLY